MRSRIYSTFTIGALLTAAVAGASSIIPPRNLGELARSSDTVVLGAALSSRVVHRGPLLFTETSFLVEQLIKEEFASSITTKGPASLAPLIVSVLAPGGDLADQGWLVGGSPRFAPGENYLLFLNRKSSQHWQPRMLSYGILRELPGRDGSVLLAPLDEVGGLEALPRPDGSAVEPLVTYRKEALLAQLEAVVHGAAWNAAGVVATPDEIPAKLSAMSPPASCRYMTAIPPYTRWRAFDTGQAGSVTIYGSAHSDPSIAGGGYSQLQSALGMWNGTTTSLNLIYGGSSSYTLSCDGNYDEVEDPVDNPATVPEYVAYGNNVVMFDDPCSDIEDLSGCTGTLGFGGPYWSGTHTHDGASWNTIVGQFVVLNDGMGCQGSTDYTLILAHELGHGLGFGHVSDANALMYPQCCHDLNSTDTTCAEYTYPPPSTDPPATPTGVSATDGTSTDYVRVTWNAASGATSYKVYRNTTNNSGGAGLIDSPSSTSYDDTSAVAGTTYWYWVVAHNSNGDSGFSTPDSGFRATCPGAPAAPAASAPALAGSAQSYNVDWSDTSPDNVYEIQEDDNAAFTSPSTFSQSGSLRSFSHTVAVATTYYYRVRARDLCSSTTYWSGWSATVSTQVVPCGTPSASAISAPAGADSGASYQVTWTSTSPDNSYDVQEATNAAFTGASTFTVASLSRSFSHAVGSATTYYYRVRARDDCGGSLYLSAWSGTDSTLVSPCTTPAAPVLSAPASSPTGQSYTVSWTATSPDPSYQLQEATNAAFTGATTFTQTGTSKLFTHSPGGNTTYYYRVRALNGCGGTTYNSAYSNTAPVQVTVCTQPAAPGLVSPAAGAKVPGPSVTLTWSAVSGATSYDVHFGQGDPPWLANVAGTSRVVAVSEGQAYAWKIVAKNACGQAASAVRSFTVCSAPAAPVANFTWSPQGAAPGFPTQQQPYVGQTVQLTDLSTNTPTVWAWYDFQEASVSYSVQNPTHSWASSGAKNVRMNSTNCQGTSGEVLKSVMVYPDARPVTADFSWAPDPATRDVAITFTAAQGYSLGDPTEFSWTFKDNNAAASGAVVTHTFACGGGVDVVLTARRGSYLGTTTKTIAVGGASCCPAPAAPVAGFSWSPQGTAPGYPQQLQPYVGQQVSLTDQSTNSPTSWAWTGLPAGSTATAQNPTAVWTTPGTYTVGLTASNCKGTSTAATHQIVVRQDIRPVDMRFDFGTSTSPIEPGYTRVVHTTAYSAAGGFGWASGTIDSRNRASGTDLSRDLNFGAEGTFLVDVPNGIYDVTVISGDQAAGHDQAGLFLEGVQLDTITTARNQWVARTYHVAVADRQLTVLLRDLGGADKFFSINALAVVTAATKRFDFGLADSPTAAGYVPVPNTLRHSAARGYGWLTGTVSGRDRGTGTDLSRDINFSTLATFAVDLPNGEFDVTVRLGDMGAGHDQMGVFLEGAYTSSLTTLVGQSEVRTYRTTVDDGQLTVLLDDLGGKDANVAITGLEVATVAPPEATVTLPGGIHLVLTRVPAGTFSMGSPSGERGRLAEEGPQHTVQLTRAYLIGKAEITQAQWQAVMGSNPASGAGVGPHLPVYEVTWNAIAGPGGFLEKLNQHLATTAQVGAGMLRLPTEAEWENAARAGTATRFAFGDAASCDDGCGSCLEAEEAMWWCGNAGSTNHVAASLEPNALGIFDTHGNVWEWVTDVWGPYSVGTQIDPTGPATGAYRVVRGGDSFGGTADCRAARREYQSPGSSAGNIGLRLARGE